MGNKFAISKKETIILGVVIGVMVPSSFFILSVIVMQFRRLYPVQERDIPLVAFSCLGLGVVLTAIRLKNWIRKFYHANLFLMAVLYLCWSAVAVAVFMGVPLGNLVWGMLAGSYIGRRKYHEEVSREVLMKSAKNAGMFTGLVTSIEALPVGLFAFGQNESTPTTNPVEIAVVILLCCILFAMQFLITKWAVRFAFGTAPRKTA